MINGYLIPLSKLRDKQFVTLTTPNVPAEKLKGEIELMIIAFQRIKKNLDVTYGIKLKGLRKLECTYNPVRNDFNPHFHLIVQGKDAANGLIDLWLKQFPKANRKGQDYRIANKESIIELCKYFTKLLTNETVYPKALDTIFQAMYRKRVYQPFGIKKIKEEGADVKNNEGLMNINEVFVWVDTMFDWININTCEPLSGHKPTAKVLKLKENILKGGRT